MDEPTATLDFGNQVRVLEHIQSLARSGIDVGGADRVHAAAVPGAPEDQVGHRDHVILVWLGGELDAGISAGGVVIACQNVSGLVGACRDDGVLPFQQRLLDAWLGDRDELLDPLEPCENSPGLVHQARLDRHSACVCVGLSRGRRQSCQYTASAIPDRALGRYASAVRQAEQDRNELRRRQVQPPIGQELLRYVSFAQMTKPRYARADTEFHGQPIRRGDAVVGNVLPDL